MFDTQKNESVRKPLVYNGLTRIHLTKELNKILKLKQEYMIKRTHGKDAKAKQEILEERIDQAKKLGTYGAAICFEIPDDNQTIGNKKKQSKTL